jgi:hypothetical protein
MVLMFEPNVNLNKGFEVEFSLYYIQNGEIKIVGAGSHPGVDLDGNLKRGELLWRGGRWCPTALIICGLRIIVQPRLFTA